MSTHYNVDVYTQKYCDDMHKSVMFFLSKWPQAENEGEIIAAAKAWQQDRLHIHCIRPTQ